MQPHVRATLCLAVIALVGYLCTRTEGPLPSLAPLYSAYAAVLLLLAACTLFGPERVLHGLRPRAI